MPGHSAGLAAKASPVSCLAPAPGNDLGCLSCTTGCLGPPAPGEEAASLGGQEEAAVAGATVRGPGCPPRKESAAGSGDPRGAAGTGRRSLCALWVGGGGFPPLRPPGSPTPRSCPPRAAAAMPVTVTLPGPAPWGFRISGGRDFGKPITVSKVGAPRGPPTARRSRRGSGRAGLLRGADPVCRPWGILLRGNGPRLRGGVGGLLWPLGWAGPCQISGCRFQGRGSLLAEGLVLFWQGRVGFRGLGCRGVLHGTGGGSGAVSPTSPSPWR